MKLSNIKDKIYSQALCDLSTDKILICCLNAHCFNVVQKDELYQFALRKSDIILPDGIAIVYALKFLTGIRLRKISGYELFFHEMERLNQAKGRCYFLGSTESTNACIKKRGSEEYPNICIDSFSPPFKTEFSEEDDRKMINAVNDFNPDVLFIGMTAPKQEKWAVLHFNELNARRICCIGAVFDFYAGTCRRAPDWIISLGFEWLHRLISEPRRLWRRYLFGNPLFVIRVLGEKVKGLKI